MKAWRSGCLNVTCAQLFGLKSIVSESSEVGGLAVGAMAPRGLGRMASGRSGAGATAASAQEGSADWRTGGGNDPVCETVPVKAQRTGGPKVLQAVTGHLREVRSDGLALWRRVKHEHGDKRSVVKAAKHRLEGWRRPVSQEMRYAMETYTSTYEALKTEYEDIGKWTLSTCNTRMTHMRGLADGLEARAVEIRKYEEAEKEQHEASRTEQGEVQQYGRAQVVRRAGRQSVAWQPFPPFVPGGRREPRHWD